MSILEKYDIEEDPRLKRAHKEMLIAFAVTALFCVTSLGTAWMLASGKIIKEYHYILGFPTWVFWVVIVIPFIFLVITSFIEIFIFQDCSLESWIYEEEKKEAKSK